jgi:type IV secretory pathway VirB10-like protein
MQRPKLIFTITLAAVALVTGGCSKKETESTGPSSPAETTVGGAETPRPAHSTPPPPVAITPATPPTLTAPSTPPAVPPSAQEETPAQLAAQVQQLESTYFNTPDLQKRVAMIYELTSIESPATIDAVGRLFVNEKDQELKIELVNSLSDIDGENDKKLNILTAAIRGDQPKDVRSEAIDALVDTEDKRAIQMLQPLLKDTDEEIREAAQDGIEQLQVDTPPMP